MSIGKNSQAATEKRRNRAQCINIHNLKWNESRCVRVRVIRFHCCRLLFQKIKYTSHIAYIRIHYTHLTPYDLRYDGGKRGLRSFDENFLCHYRHNSCWKYLIFNTFSWDYTILWANRAGISLILLCKLNGIERRTFIYGWTFTCGICMCLLAWKSKSQGGRNANQGADTIEFIQLFCFYNFISTPCRVSQSTCGGTLHWTFSTAPPMGSGKRSQIQTFSQLQQIAF